MRQLIKLLSILAVIVLIHSQASAALFGAGEEEESTQQTSQQVQQEQPGQGQSDFSTYDLDQDKSISREEFDKAKQEQGQQEMGAQKQQHGQHAQHGQQDWPRQMEFEELDTNKDGVISQEEFEAVEMRMRKKAAPTESGVREMGAPEQPGMTESQTSGQTGETTTGGQQQ